MKGLLYQVLCNELLTVAHIRIPPKKVKIGTAASQKSPCQRLWCLDGGPCARSPGPKEGDDESQPGLETFWSSWECHSPPQATVEDRRVLILRRDDIGPTKRLIKDPCLSGFTRDLDGSLHV